MYAKLFLPCVICGEAVFVTNLLFKHLREKYSVNQRKKMRNVKLCNTNFLLFIRDKIIKHYTDRCDRLKVYLLSKYITLCVTTIRRLLKTIKLN